MKKVKIYRVLGWVLVVYGIVGYFASLLSPEKFQGFIANPKQEFMPALYGSLMLFATNIFLWGGIILHWRADRNEDSHSKSNWSKFIKPYLIFTIIIFVWTAYLLIAPNLLGK